MNADYSYNSNLKCVRHMEIRYNELIQYYIQKTINKALFTYKVHTFAVEIY